MRRRVINRPNNLTYAEEMELETEKARAGECGICEEAKEKEKAI